MNIHPSSPTRPLLWTPPVERLAECVLDPSRVLLVGGCVRDALRGRPVHDLDLVTFDSGLEIARHIANTLKGAYYALDTNRRTGRAVIEIDGEQLIIDVASLRGDDLLADLQRRDFTVNAMAVELASLHEIVDPLDGQSDLFTHRLLRQCHPGSISDDPIRALRAVRLALQLGLHFELATREAARAAAQHLNDEHGRLLQPERVRDELFRLLSGSRPEASLRLLDALGLLRAVLPLCYDDSASLLHRLSVIDTMSGLINVISPSRDDNTAADLFMGVAVIILDRFRRQLQQHFSAAYADSRERKALLELAVMLPPNTDWTDWGSALRLSNAEVQTLSRLAAARLYSFPTGREPTDRVKFLFFREAGDAGVDTVVLILAQFIADNQPTPDPHKWGWLLEHFAAPLLDAFFNRHQQVVAPIPLLTGDDLQEGLSLTPGPIIGRLQNRLIEEQAAGDIQTKQQALNFARLLVSEDLTLAGRRHGPTSTTNGS